MAKGNRKRSNKTSPRKAATKKKDAKVSPLMAHEGQLIQQFVNLAQNYNKILKQEQQYDFLVKSMEKTRKKIQDGEVTALNIPVAPNTTAPITDKKDMLEYIDEQLKVIKQALLGIRGQVEHKKDLFVEHGLHLKEWCEKRFGKEVTKKITDRRKAKESEKVLFEQAFEDLDLEAFEGAKKEAVKLNAEKAKSKK